MSMDTRVETWVGNGHMAEMPTKALLDDFRSESSRFLRAEVEVIREDLQEEVRGAARGAAMAGAGGAVLYVSLFALAGTAIALLSLALPVWASALIVTGIYAIVGAALAAAGRKRLKTVRPDTTLNEFKEDARWLQRMTRDMKAQRHASA